MVFEFVILSVERMGQHQRREMPQNVQGLCTISEMQLHGCDDGKYNKQRSIAEDDEYQGGYAEELGFRMGKITQLKSENVPDDVDRVLPRSGYTYAEGKESYYQEGFARASSKKEIREWGESCGGFWISTKPNFTEYTEASGKDFFMNDATIDCDGSDSHLSCKHFLCLKPPKSIADGKDCKHDSECINGTCNLTHGRCNMKKYNWEQKASTDKDFEWSYLKEWGEDCNEKGDRCNKPFDCRFLSYASDPEDKKCLKVWQSVEYGDECKDSSECHAAEEAWVMDCRYIAGGNLKCLRKSGSTKKGEQCKHDSECQSNYCRKWICNG